MEEVFTILLFVTGANTNYTIPIPCQTNYEQLKITASNKIPLSRFWPRCTPGKMSRCSGVIREDLAHLYISVTYIRWYCRCRDGLNPGSSRCSHRVTRPYTVSLSSVKDVPRCRPGLVPVHHGSARCSHGSARCSHGSPRCSHGSPRSVGTAFGFNLCFPSRRCNSNWLVSKCARNKLNIRDYLKVSQKVFFTFTHLFSTDCLRLKPE